MTPKRFPVSERAVVQRINRALADEKQELWFYRNNKVKGFENGAYVIIDNRRKGDPVTGEPVDLEKFAKGCGVMKEWEFIEK
jgi:hypothetical protein